MSTNRQTASFLQHRLAEVGIRPDTRHGQNFLIDLNLVQLLVDAAELTADDVVLEVGTGTGSLTAMMARLAGAVISVEIAPELHQLAREELGGVENVTLLHQDVLRNKNNIADNVLASVQEKLDEVPNSHFKLAANLPYNIATPLISNLLICSVVPDAMVITIQKELADRILAVPSTKDYGSLSVWVQSQCHAELIRTLPPSVFWPRPKVNSAIIRIRTDHSRRAQIPDLKFFHHFVRAIFRHRRKFLRSVMISAYKHELEKVEVDAILADAELRPDLRAEQLSLDQLQTLCEAARQRIEAKNLE